MRATANVQCACGHCLGSWDCWAENQSAPTHIFTIWVPTFATKIRHKWIDYTSLNCRDGMVPVKVRMHLDPNSYLSHTIYCIMAISCFSCSAHDEKVLSRRFSILPKTISFTYAERVQWSIFVSDVDTPRVVFFHNTVCNFCQDLKGEFSTCESLPFCAINAQPTMRSTTCNKMSAYTVWQRCWRNVLKTWSIARRWCWNLCWLDGHVNMDEHRRD